MRLGTSSLPSRERGLKYRPGERLRQRRQVAPFTGAWIEIRTDQCAEFRLHVAPFTGAWIEMLEDAMMESATESLPSRERGLKYGPVEKGLADLASLPSRERGLKFCGYMRQWWRAWVAPFTGAWIEIG